MSESDIGVTILPKASLLHHVPAWLPHVVDVVVLLLLLLELLLLELVLLELVLLELVLLMLTLVVLDVL